MTPTDYELTLTPGYKDDPDDDFEDDSDTPILRTIRQVTKITVERHRRPDEDCLMFHQSVDPARPFRVPLITLVCITALPAPPKPNPAQRPAPLQFDVPFTPPPAPEQQIIHKYQHRLNDSQTEQIIVIPPGQFRHAQIHNYVNLPGQWVTELQIWCASPAEPDARTQANLRGQTLILVPTNITYPAHYPFLQTLVDQRSERVWHLMVRT